MTEANVLFLVAEALRRRDERVKTAVVMNPNAEFVAEVRALLERTGRA